MVDPLTYIPDIHTFVVPVICGFVGSKSVKLHGDSILLNIVQIARICFTNAGTFTHATGLDQDGNAAFTVETETVIIADEYVASHVQARAHIPISPLLNRCVHRLHCNGKCRIQAPVSLLVMP